MPQTNNFVIFRKFFVAGATATKTSATPLHRPPRAMQPRSSSRPSSGHQEPAAERHFIMPSHSAESNFTKPPIPPPEVSSRPQLVQVPSHQDSTRAPLAAVSPNGWKPASNYALREQSQIVPLFFPFYLSLQRQCVLFATATGA
jgi:hypothetical protein